MRTFLPLALLTLCPTLAAQVPRALVRLGDAPLFGPDGEVVIDLDGLSACGGIFAAGLTTGGIDPQSHLWMGNGTQGTIARSEQILGGFDQQQLLPPFQLMEGGGLMYGALVDDLGSSATGLPSLWIEDQPIAIDGQPIPSLPGQRWGQPQQPVASKDGVVHWVGGIIDIGTGNPQGAGLFRFDPMFGEQPLLLPGDVLPPLPPLQQIPIGQDHGISELGNQWIAGVNVQSGSSFDDTALVINGQLVNAHGGFFREGEGITPLQGGLPGENWGEFHIMDIIENGNWMAGGTTTAPPGFDDVLVLDGQIIFREGDVVSGLTLDGPLEQAILLPGGDLIHAWPVHDGVDPLQQAVFFNETPLLIPGLPVDWDQDGFLDPNAFLSDPFLPSDFGFDPLGRFTFIGDCDVAGSQDRGLIMMDLEPLGWTPYGVPGGANVLTLDGFGTSTIGGGISFVTEGIDLLAPFALGFLSLQQLSVPALGGTILVDPTVPNLQLPLLLDQPILGTSRMDIPIPPEPSLGGLDLFLQAVAPSPAQPAGWALSNGLKVTLRTPSYQDCKIEILNAACSNTSFLRIGHWGADGPGWTLTGYEAADPFAVRNGPAGVFIDTDPDRFFVRVTDLPANTNPAVAEIVFAEVFTIGGAIVDSPTTLRLLETGPNTGVFKSESQLLTVDDVANLGDDDLAVYSVRAGAAVADEGLDDRTHKTSIRGTTIATYNCVSGAIVADTKPVCNRNLDERRVLSVRVTVLEEPPGVDISGDGVINTVLGPVGGLAAIVDAHIARANLAWAQACIEVRRVGGIRVLPATSPAFPGMNAIADGDFDFNNDEFFVTSSPAHSAGISPNVLEVYWVAPMGALGFTRAPECALPQIGGNTYCFIRNTAGVDTRVLAHEIGHALDNLPAQDAAQPKYLQYPAGSSVLDTAVNQFRRIRHDTEMQARVTRAAGAANYGLPGNTLLIPFTR